MVRISKKGGGDSFSFLIGLVAFVIMSDNLGWFLINLLLSLCPPSQVSNGLPINAPVHTNPQRAMGNQLGDSDNDLTQYSGHYDGWIHAFRDNIFQTQLRRLTNCGSKQETWWSDRIHIYIIYICLSLWIII